MPVTIGDAGAGACLAANMKNLRKELGLSQEQLSDRSGVPRSTIASLERGEGNPTLLVLMGIARGFGVSITELLVQRQPRATLFKSEQHSRMSYPLEAGDDPKMSTNSVIETLRLTPMQARHLVIEQVTLNAGQQIVSSPHAAGTEEYFFLAEGNCDVEVCGEIFTVSQGDLLRFDGDQKHVYRSSESRNEQVARGFAVVVQAPRV
ncbi:helix-turn-helix domain-containing protein [bacterium]|nr:helix-turn-helix domain-containing protein [bacterium]